MTPKRALMSRILLATDGSASARAAEDLACVLAKAFEARLDVVNVLEFEPWRDLSYQVNQLYLEDRGREIREQLGAAVQDASARGITVERHQPIGVPSQEIIGLATGLRSDLLVLGTHGRTGLDYVLIGSTAERVVRGAPCPVVTVKGPPVAGRPDAPRPAQTTRTAKGQPSLARLLVAMDFSECSQEAVEYAGQLAERFGSAITLLHVVEPVAYGLDFTLSHALTGTALRSEIERSMADLASVFEQRGLSTRHEIIPGLPADVLPRVAQTENSDAIIMGTHGRRGWSHVRFGSVAESVVRHARCPVFTVRSPKFKPPAQDGALSQQEPSARATP